MYRNNTVLCRSECLETNETGKDLDRCQRRGTEFGSVSKRRDDTTSTLSIKFFSMRCGPFLLRFRPLFPDL